MCRFSLHPFKTLCSYYLSAELLAGENLGTITRESILFYIINKNKIISLELLAGKDFECFVKMSPWLYLVVKLFRTQEFPIYASLWMSVRVCDHVFMHICVYVHIYAYVCLCAGVRFCVRLTLVGNKQTTFMKPVKVYCKP